MRIQFTLQQSPGARKAFRISAELKAAMKQAAKQVAETEIAGLRRFTLGVVTMTDEELLQLNVSALGHDWYTDIITFELEREVDSEASTDGEEAIAMEAELYISVERAQENAKKAKVTIEHELVHLVIHGVLHLAGYDDHDPVKKKRMKNRERFYLSLV